MHTFQKYVDYAVSILLILLAGILSPAGADGSWEKIQQILEDHSEIIILNGTEVASSPPSESSQSAYGDWLVCRIFADPQSLNPFLFSDVHSYDVLTLVFQSLLYAEKTPPYAMKPLLATSLPSVSPDRRSYTFELRDTIYFSDGTPLTIEDVLFSYKVV